MRIAKLSVLVLLVAGTSLTIEMSAHANGDPGSWGSLTGGCRVAGGGQGNYRLYRNVDSLATCKGYCMKSNGKTFYPDCSAVEYNPGTGACEVHQSRITSSTGDTSHGTRCYVLK